MTDIREIFHSMSFSSPSVLFSPSIVDRSISESSRDSEPERSSNKYVDANRGRLPVDGTFPWFLSP